MEGCPKVLMISYDIKEPIAADFSTAIRNYIQEYYQENPDSYKNELQQLHQLNASIANVTRDNQGCSIYRKYFAQLQFLQSRFPMSFGGAAAMSFTWYDVYTGDPITQKDIRYEQACVLFNLGGLYSQLGANEQRSTDESMKVACTYFQCAAGAFQYLRDNFSFTTLPDMGFDILKLKSTIMLSQGQECLLEKSIRDNRKNTLIARISMQIKDYYQEAVKLLEDSGTSEMGSQLRKSWTKHLKMKINMYSAITYIYMSNEANDEQKFGEKVAYLKAAMERINEAMKLSKNQPEQVLETLKFLRDVAGNKYDAAAKENDFVYHALVPELGKLPEIKGVSLVKPVPFQYNDPSISGPDIFQRLIPMRAHEASSLYSEEKANLLRKIKAEIEEKDLLLGESLTSMHIDDLINPVEDSLPESLVQKCNELRESDGIVSKTAEQIKELAILAEEFEVIFTDLSTKLKSIEAYERDAKVGSGEGGVSAELEELKKEFTRCNDANEKARNTNVTLCHHFEENKDVVEFLQGPEDQILASLPSQNFIDAPSDEPVVQRIRELLAAIEKMKVQRKDLEKQLREELNKDDITSLLVIKEDGNQEGFFKEQLAKHDERIAIIRQNLSAQDNIILQLTEANAKYAKTRVAALEVAAKREAKIQEYLGNASLFVEVKGRLSHGLTFYNDLKDTLKKLEKRVDDFYQKRGKEKAKFMEKKAKDTPPPRPTAAKPTFDRSSKPKGAHPARSLQHDGQFIPHSQAFPPVQPQNIPMQSPNMPSSIPTNQFQNVPPGSGITASGSVPNSNFSALPNQGQQLNQLPSSLTHQLPHQQQQQPQHQQPQQQHKFDYRPQQQQPSSQHQKPPMPAEMPIRFTAPESPQPRFHAVPQKDEFPPQLFTTGGSTLIANRFSVSGQVPSQPLSMFQAVSTHAPAISPALSAQQNLRPQLPQSQSPGMMQGDQQGLMHGILQGPPLGQQQRPLLGQQQRPLLGQQQRPILEQQQRPLLGQQPGPPMGQLGQQQGPPMGQQQIPSLGQQQGPLQVQQQRPPLGQQPRPMLGQQQRPPLGQHQGSQLGQQQELTPRQQQGTIMGQQQGPPLGQHQGPLQGQLHKPQQGHRSSQELSHVPMQGPQHGIQHIPSQVPQQGGSMHPPRPSQNMPPLGPSTSPSGIIPPRGISSIRGMPAPIRNQAPFHMDQASQQFIPYEQNLMQQPHMHPQQNIREPSPQQSQFSGPMSVPISGMDNRMLSSHGQMKLPSENDILMQQELHPKFQPMQRADQWHGQQPQGQQLPGPVQLRPQAPVQKLSQDSRYPREIPHQMHGPQSRYDQAVGQHTSPSMDMRSSGQDFVIYRQGAQEPFIPDQRGSQNKYLPQHVSADGKIQYPGMQQLYQPGLHLPEPLRPVQAMPQNLLDTANAEVLDKPLDLTPTPLKCEAEQPVISNSIPVKTMPNLSPDGVKLFVSDNEFLRRETQDQVQSQRISLNYQNQNEGHQAPPYSPSGQVQGSNIRPNELSSHGEGSVDMVGQKSNTEDPRMAQQHIGSREKPMMSSLECASTRVANFNTVAPGRNQYALQGPMSSPVPERITPVSMRTERQQISLPPNNANILQPGNEFTSLQSDHSPTAPPISAYSQPPPFSPNRPLDPITMNNRPVMATAHSTDPIVSGILGVDRVSQQKDMMQMGFQQFQIQQMMLQQQQLISMIQSQQSQQKAAESSYMEQLQKQLLEQQKIIERLADEQHKMIEQQQQTAQASQNQSQEMHRMQVEYQQKYQQMREQQEQLAIQKSLLMSLQNTKSSASESTGQELKTGNQIYGLEKATVDTPSKPETADAEKALIVSSASLVSNELNSLNRPESEGNSTASKSLDLQYVSEYEKNKETPESFTSKTKLVVSSIMSAFDLSPQTGKNEDHSPKHNKYSIKNELSTSAGLPQGSNLVATSVAAVSGVNNQTALSSQDQQFKFDLNQFEEEMNAVLSGDQKNELTTPTKKEAVDNGHDMARAPADVLSSHSLKSGELLSKDDKEKTSDIVTTLNDSSATLESSPPFYEPMLDIEQRLKHLGVPANAPPEQGDSALTSENFVQDSSTVKNSLESADKSTVVIKGAGILDGVDVKDLAMSDMPTIDPYTKKDDEINRPSKLPDYPSISKDSGKDLDTSIKDMDSLSEMDLDILLPNVPACTSPIPKILTPGEEETDDSPLPSPTRPQLNRQEGRLSFYQAAESEVEKRAYLEDLDTAVDLLHRQCMEYCKKVPGMIIDGFTRLWNDLAQVEELDSCSYSAEAGRDNPNKNRYRDILPWDHTRVHLKSLSTGDYINANHVNNLTPCSPKYIATQGPIPQSFIDFWTMVWEQHCVVIVMLTNEVEGTKLKCHPYWPRRLAQATEYGDLLVCLGEQEAGASWICRTFLITHNETKETRTVKHLQFTSWPDYGIPNTPYDLLAFNEEVRSCHSALDPKLLSPLLLHCSAGVGRTGTFACIYSASEEIMGGNGLVDVPGLIRKLRQCRFHMVQRKEQLIFCYQAILCYAQQFLTEEQMKQERELNSTDEPHENLAGVCTNKTSLVSEKLANSEATGVASGNNDTVDKGTACQTVNSEEGFETEQKQDKNGADNVVNNPVEYTHETNTVSNTDRQDYVMDKSVASTSSNHLHLELDRDGPLDEKNTGQERGDNIPKFKVKSDIFASKSPPVSPGFSPLTHDDKA